MHCGAGLSTGYTQLSDWLKNQSFSATDDLVLLKVVVVGIVKSMLNAEALKLAWVASIRGLY